jgi:hypothetical protein
VLANAHEELAGSAEPQPIRIGDLRLADVGPIPYLMFRDVLVQDERHEQVIIEVCPRVILSGEMVQLVSRPVLEWAHPVAGGLHDDLPLS